MCHHFITSSTKQKRLIVTQSLIFDLKHHIWREEQHKWPDRAAVLLRVLWGWWVMLAWRERGAVENQRILQQGRSISDMQRSRTQALLWQPLHLSLGLRLHHLDSGTPVPGTKPGTTWVASIIRWPGQRSEVISTKVPVV